jgi:zearalenone synthase, nonreducing iterative type I polyketide synthase
VFILICSEPGTNKWGSRHAETDPSLLIGNSSPVIALSISGSMLAAAAAAVANDVGELIEVATFLAVVSCRQAVEIRRRGMKIEHDSGDWAFSALGEIVNQLPSILSQFNENQVSQEFPSAHHQIPKRKKYTY